MRRPNRPPSTLAVPAPRIGRRHPGGGAPNAPKREPQKVKVMPGPPKDGKALS